MDMNETQQPEPVMQFVGIRKHFFLDKTYYISVFDTHFTMGDKPNLKYPKYHYTLTLDTKIGWQVRINNGMNYLSGFQFVYRGNDKTMHCQSADLAKFKQFIDNKVTYMYIQKLHQPITQFAKGGQGKVYQTKCLLNNQLYAVKAINKGQLSQEENGLTMFHTELAIMKELSCYDDNFIKLCELYENGGTTFFVMQYLEGSTLSEEINKLKLGQQQQFNITDIKIIMRKLFINLSLLHKHNIIHRDVKPDNLVFGRKGNYHSLTLVDFGLSKYLDDFPYIYPRCGTPGFVAPEVLNYRHPQKYGTNVDMFSAGCIFYKLLTGRSLFKGADADMVLKANKHCTFKLDLQPNDYITQTSLELLKQLLEVNPANRITSEQAIFHPYFESPIDLTMFSYPIYSMNQPQDLQQSIPEQLVKIEFNEELLQQSNHQEFTPNNQTHRFYFKNDQNEMQIKQLNKMMSTQPNNFSQQLSFQTQ